jgi:hypothetical protein
MSSRCKCAGSNCIDCKKTRVKTNWAKCLDIFQKQNKTCTEAQKKINPQCPCPPKIKFITNHSSLHLQQSKKMEQSQIIKQSFLSRKWRRAVYDKKTKKYIISGNSNKECRTQKIT